MNRWFGCCDTANFLVAIEYWDNQRAAVFIHCSDTDTLLVTDFEIAPTLRKVIDAFQFFCSLRCHINKAAIPI